MPSTSQPVASTSAAELFDGLGSFWGRVSKDADLMRRWCVARNLDSTQADQRMAECSASLARRKVPDFDRTRWYPIVIRASERGTGAAVRLHVGMTDVNIGPQEWPRYPSAAVYSVGGCANPLGYVSYPCRTGGAAPVGGLHAITSGVGSPAVILTRGADFYSDSGCVVLRSIMDPFNNTAFARRRFFNTEIDADDEELTLWGCDALMNAEGMLNHFGRVLELPPSNGARYSDMVNAVFDARVNASAKGALSAFRLAFGVKETLETETVKVLVDSDDGAVVVTDKRAYRLGGAAVAPYVTLNAALPAGTELSDAVRMWDLVGDNPSAEFRALLPRLRFTRDALGRYGGAGGIAADWVDSDIVYNGDDANGNPRFSFRLDGVESDVELYWKKVWSVAETTGFNLYDAFAEWVPAGYAKKHGAAVGSLKPLEFFCANFIGRGAIVVRVDVDRLPDNDGFAAIDELAACLPARCLLFVVAAADMGSKPYDLDTGRDTIDSMDGRGMTASDGEYYRSSISYRTVRKCS